MFYNFPVTQPMYIPQDPPAGRFSPELKDVPGLVDTRIEGIRLLNTLPKALPGMKSAVSGTSARQEDARKKAREMAIAFNITKRANQDSERIRKLKDKAAEDRAKSFPYR